MSVQKTNIATYYFSNLKKKIGFFFKWHNMISSVYHTRNKDTENTDYVTDKDLQ